MDQAKQQTKHTMKLTTIIKRLGGFEEVQNLKTQSGNEAPNQFILYFEHGSIFQSYRSVIAVKYRDKTYLTDDWNYSRTTSKYRTWYLNESTKDTRDKINNGRYKILQ